MTNDTYINAWSVVELMRKIRKKSPTGKIVLVLDNARYQACYVVRTAANMMHIELLYLPLYSPNLNLIERVWKFISITNSDNEHKEELRTLLQWNFQTFASGCCIIRIHTI